jgi:hypothetical protein
MIPNVLARLLKHNATPGVLCFLAVVIILRSLWLWQPSRQVMLHQEHLLDAAEHRNWSRFSAFIDDQYSDRWHHDKPFLVRESSEVFRQFFSLSIKRELVACVVQGGDATVTMRLKLEGAGTPIASYASSAVSELSAPFSFQWKRRSWKPWDWALVSADQPQLRLEHVEGF